MDKALFISMTGAKNTMLAQASHSNNLANINTTGFKGEFARQRSIPVFHGDGLPTRAFSIAESQGTNFKHGAMIETGNDLDIAIESDGFIAVQAHDGQESLTRAGALHVDALGVLRNGSGLPVMGNGGPIAIPAAEKIEIAVDGSITIVPLGQSANAPAVIDRIRLVTPPLDTIKKMGDGLFRVMNPEQDVPADPNVRIASGFLEGSNVNAVDELVSVLGLSRQYEMQVKMMKTVKENSEASARLLQIS